jgi:hypothetical protein
MWQALGWRFRKLVPCFCDIHHLVEKAHVTLNLDPPNLYLPRSWDYRCDPLCPAHQDVFLIVQITWYNKCTWYDTIYLYIEGHTNTSL